MMLMRNLKIVICTISLLVASAAIQVRAGEVPSPNSNPVSDGPAGPNALARTAAGAGQLSCANRVQMVSSFLGFGPTAEAYAPASSGVPDRSLFALSMALPAGASGDSWVGMQFAPLQANGCGATYEAVSYWKQSCIKLAAGPYAALRKSGYLRKDIAVLVGADGATVYLLQAGDGCISIKQEIVR